MAKIFLLLFINLQLLIYAPYRKLDIVDRIYLTIYMITNYHKLRYYKKRQSDLLSSNIFSTKLIVSDNFLP